MGGIKLERQETGPELNREIKTIELSTGDGQGPPGQGLPSGTDPGDVNKLVRFIGPGSFAYELFTLTKDFIGLGNVTDDAQLKRSAGDYQAFPQKISPELTDYVLGEDSSDGENKKRFTLSGILTLFKATFDAIYLAASGGTLIDYLEAQGAAYTEINGTYIIPATGNVFWLKLTANTEIELPAIPSSTKSRSFALNIDCNGFVVTWKAAPAKVWSTTDRAAPTLDTTSGVVNRVPWESNEIDSKWMGDFGGTTG